MNKEKEISELKIQQNQVTQIVISVIALMFLFFMAGFYWGKRTVLKDVLNQFENDSLSDKLSYAFYSLNDFVDFENSEADDQEQLNNTQSPEVAPSEITPVEIQADSVESVENNIENNNDNSIKLYRACLAGFGSEKYAQNCFKYIRNSGFDVELLVRNSKTVKGKNIKWYQIVTRPVADMALLQNIVEKVKKTIKLNNDIQIVTLEQAD